MNPVADPYVITPREKAKYQDQFKDLNPQDGMITGAQAKGFFLQSQLHPLILGQIWSLADINCDGKMDINEFSIACKLINLKLRGIEVPKELPPSLLKSLQTTASATPTLTPTGQGSLSPLDPLKAKPIVPAGVVPPIAQIPPMMTAAVPTVGAPAVAGGVGVGVGMGVGTGAATGVGVAPIPANLPGAVPAIPGLVPGTLPGVIPQMVPSVVANQGVMPGGIMGAGAVIPPVGAIPGSTPMPVVPPTAVAGVIPGVPPMAAGQVPGMLPAGMVPGVAPIPGAPIPGVTAPVVLPAPGSAAPAVVAKLTSPPAAATPGIGGKAAATPTPPQSNPPSRNMSISERAPSIESPGQGEWAVQPLAKLKYTQVFNATDRTRSGFLTGVQARNLLMQSKLPQATLAQIWSLSDLDLDGRLSCDEFILAMFLCEKAMSGEKIPPTLPNDWIPPNYRKNKSRTSSVSGIVSRPGSQPASRHASVSSQGAIDADPAAGLPQTTFEDKRKENFDKGQAELDRRRKLLQEQQRKEKEERERKEREEAEKREKARLEAERKQQEELERQLQKERELEMEKEEQRKRELEAKEAARKELEKQRQLEWEQARIAEMNTQKQREQERVLKQKAHNTHLNVELSTLNEKIKDLSQKICDTRAGVTNIKSIIDGMREQRDTSMAEMASLKARIKEQNAKLLVLTQERAKWDAKAKAGANPDSAQQEQMNAAFANKQLIIKQLKDKVENIQKEIETKKEDINSNDVQVAEVKGELSLLIKKCEELYADYDTQRTNVLEMKYNKKNENVTAVSAWGETTASDWNTNPADAYGTMTNELTSGTIADSVQPIDTSGPPPEGFVKYRAIYEFSARNADEISFMPGDIILVPIEQNAEPDWLAGEINGHTGWFPESYVEKIEEEYPEAVAAPVETADLGAYAAQDAYNDNTQQYSSDQVEYYIAAYPYESNEVGDLSFQAGEMIMVIKKEGDWWTGTIGTRTGMFPSNYVQKADIGGTTAAPVETTDTTTSAFEQKANANVNGNDAAVYEAANIIANQPMVNATANITTAEETRTNEELDTEVSQINTQSKTQAEPAESYSRPMSRTSSMTPGMRAKRSEIAQVIAPYDATSAEQLSLTRGQLIMIRKKTETGWWEGELQAKGKRRQIGWFPASYVKVLQGGRNSGRNTPVSGSRIEMIEQILDKVIALYPYKAQNDDELSFDKDDIISVLGRDEAEWWRGELNGLTGLFPSNYVGPFVTSGKNPTTTTANATTTTNATPIHSQSNGQ